MSEEILIRQGAPTLAGIKTGSLFPCPCENREALLVDIRRLNWWLSPKGSCLLPLRFLAGRALFYYTAPLDCGGICWTRRRPSCCVRRATATIAARCVARLARRVRESGEFPHEVGLPLSYRRRT